MMKGLSYSIWQGWCVFWKERRKFYFVALEVALAVALLSVLLTTLYSIQQQKSLLLSSSEEMNFRMRLSVTAPGHSGPPLSQTDVASIQHIFGDKADVYLICSRSSDWAPISSVSRLITGKVFIPAGAAERIHLIYSTAIPEGKYYASGKGEKPLLSEEYVCDLEPEAVALRSGVNSGRLSKLDWSPHELSTLLARHLGPLEIMYLGYQVLGIEMPTEEDIILLPLSEYGAEARRDDFMLAVFLTKQDFCDKEIMETVQFVDSLLTSRHGDQFSYECYSGVERVRTRIENLTMIATVIAIVTVTVLIIIILGLGGIMASIVKKMMKEIGIRLCLGVDRELVRLETLLATCIPAVVGGLIGAIVARYAMAFVSEDMLFVTSVPLWASAGAVGFAVLAGVLAAQIPLRQLGNLHPLEVLREVN